MKFQLSELYFPDFIMLFKVDIVHVTSCTPPPKKKKDVLLNWV